MLHGVIGGSAAPPVSLNETLEALTASPVVHAFPASCDAVYQRAVAEIEEQLDVVDWQMTRDYFESLVKVRAADCMRRAHRAADCMCPM